MPTLAELEQTVEKAFQAVIGHAEAAHDRVLRSLAFELELGSDPVATIVLALNLFRLLAMDSEL